MFVRRHGPAARFLGSFVDALPPARLPEVAFAGRSNVGKSSAINALLGAKKAARVSSRPGRTQHINLFQLGEVATLADLPGYGYAAVPDEVADKWKPMIERYLAERDALRLVVLLVDARREPQELDTLLLEGLRDFGLPVCVVATKLDKLKRSQQRAVLAGLQEAWGLDDGLPIGFSSKDGTGRDEVWDAIEAAVAGPGWR